MLARASGTPIDGAMIEADVADGAPTNPDGTLNLIRYAAWLIREEPTRRRGD